MVKADNLQNFVKKNKNDNIFKCQLFKFLKVVYFLNHNIVEKNAGCSMTDGHSCQATPDKVIGGRKCHKISSTILQNFPPGKQILQKKTSNVFSNLNIAFENTFYTFP